MKIKLNKEELQLLRKTHKVDEMANMFDIPKGTMEKYLREFGIYSEKTKKRKSCPAELNEIQKEIINGNLLGDGSLSIPIANRNSCFKITQKLDNEEYIDYLYSVFLPYSSAKVEGKSKKPCRIDGEINHNNWNGEYCYKKYMYTVCHPAFTEYRKIWYENPYEKNSNKVVPRDLELTWRTASFWACDDGSNNVGNFTFTMYTDCFYEKDVEFLVFRLKKDLNVVGKIYKRLNKHIINIYGDEKTKFINGIKEFIPWQCFSHKLLLRDKISRNTSGCIGVFFDKSGGKWCAIITNGEGKWTYKKLNSYDEAVAVRKTWELTTTKKLIK